MQVRDGNPGGQDGVVGVLGGHGGGNFRCQVVEFHRRYAIVDAVDHFFGDFDRADEIRVKAVAKLFNPGSNFIKFNRFAPAISFYN